MRAALVLAALALAWGPAREARAEGCPEAKRLLAVHDGPAAEQAARACLTAHGDDVPTWSLLGQAIGIQGRYGEAIGWLDRALARFPQDDELTVVRTRLLAWSGRLDEAWTSAQKLSAETLLDPDAATVVANVALWRKDNAEAARRYDAVLARYPDYADARRGRGIARQELGDLTGAAEDFAAHCQLEPGGDGCRFGQAVAARRSRLRLRVAPGLSLIQHRGDGYTLAGEAQLELAPPVRVLAGVERRTRDFGMGPTSDGFAQGLLVVRLHQRLTIAAGGGAGIARKFSPAWTAEIEPATALGGVELYLKYWRISFPGAGVHVVSPAAVVERGSWILYGRYFLAAPQGTSTKHAGMGRVTRLIGERWSVWAGGGGGTGVDYMELHGGPVGHFAFGWAGLAWSPSWRHRFTVDAVGRSESAGSQTFRQLNLLAGYEVRL